MRSVSIQDKMYRCFKMSMLNDVMEIKFSHRDYRKLRHVCIDDDLVLLEVFTGQSDKLSFMFTEYDTVYDENGVRHNFVLPRGKVIVLLFLDINGNLFTTTRRYTDRKYEYYIGSRGKIFRVKFE
jgi:hypothetical protein